MLKRKIRDYILSLSDIYNTHDDHAKGRLVSLGSSLLTAFYNVFITGIFYTGFLSMYDISITDFGIITFIPYIGNCFSVFSGLVLRRFKKRKKILLIAKIYFYAMYILATTLMPQFILEKAGRMYAFIIILFLAHSVYALFSPGLTTWFYNFYPMENERRTRYIALNQIFSSITSSLILILSSFITDAVAGSPYQKTIILSMRYLAFILVLIDVFIQSRAAEYPYPESAKLKLRQVFILPFRYRKFMYCIAFMFFWNFLANFNNGLWSYHLLNHMHFPYLLINAMSVMYTFILISTQGVWRRILRRYSWIKTFGLTNLIWVPTEILYFFMSVDRGWMFVPLSFIQNLLSVGLNLSYANILYLNLPQEDSTTHIAFYSIGCNLFAFLGLMLGTAVSSITGDTPVMLLGMPVYSVQYTTLMRAAAQLTVGLVLTLGWKYFTPEADIAEIDKQASITRVHREATRKAIRQFIAAHRFARRNSKRTGSI